MSSNEHGNASMPLMIRQKQKRMRVAAAWAQGAMVAFFIANAVLTAMYGYAVVYLAIDTSTGRGKALAFLMGTIAAVFLMLLTDGARFLWDQARVASGSSKWQQWIATGMTIFAFGGSVWASVIALQFIADLIGIYQVGDVMASHELMITFLSSAIIAHVTAAFGYVNASAEASQLRTLARAESAETDAMSEAISDVYNDSNTRMGELVQGYMEGMIEKNARRKLERLLRAMGHGDYAALPEVAQEESQTVLPPPPSPAEPLSIVEFPLSDDGREETEEAETNYRPSVHDFRQAGSGTTDPLPNGSS